jgi:hypothetical protein
VRAYSSYDYAVIRVVPRVERGEFINVGVIMWCSSKDLLEARFDLQAQRIQALHPGADLESIRRHLESISLICRGGEAAGPLGNLSKRERFDWLIAPRSTMIQTSSAHTGRCTDLDATLEHLLNVMVRPGAAGGHHNYPPPGNL